MLKAQAKPACGTVSVPLTGKPETDCKGLPFVWTGDDRDHSSSSSQPAPDAVLSWILPEVVHLKRLRELSLDYDGTLVVRQTCECNGLRCMDSRSDLLQSCLSTIGIKPTANSCQAEVYRLQKSTDY